jgi:hypothetical protein
LADLLYNVPAFAHPASLIQEFPTMQKSQAAPLLTPLTWFVLSLMPLLSIHRSESSRQS